MLAAALELLFKKKNSMTMRHMEGRTKRDCLRPTFCCYSKTASPPSHPPSQQDTLEWQVSMTFACGYQTPNLKYDAMCTARIL